VILINNSRFENIRCKRCSGLIVSAKESSVKVFGSEFINNRGYQASCIYIDNKGSSNFIEREEVEKKGDQYFIRRGKVEISGNKFIRNNATHDSACIYMKYVGISSVKNNNFENNKARYGSCLYLNNSDGNNKNQYSDVYVDYSSYSNNMQL